MERIKVLIWEKVSLVVPEKIDAEVWYKWINDIETQSFLGSMYWEIITLEDEQEYYEHIRKDKNTKLFSIFVNDINLVVWNISLMEIDLINRKCELWISIFDKEYREKWLWTESIKLILNYAFKVLWLNKVNLRYVDFNRRAWAVYEKIWFNECWRLKEEAFRNWKLYDDIYMEIFSRDYKIWN